MKLKQDALAMITLGPQICKDKVMQAAGRMIQLDKEQSLLTIGPEDVVLQIIKINCLKQE